ncbi:hypothetical protein [Methylocystis echinoides]|uniref:hypothetical protein n=1 Tax=Methylocystis echinoides TaxID=29468 RepID=UPI00248F7CD8|nr:hypothetical protein [Methylocystis echinoides]
MTTQPFANAQNFIPRESSQPTIFLAKQGICAKAARLDFTVARQYVARGLEKVRSRGRGFSIQAAPEYRIIS